MNPTAAPIQVGRDALSRNNTHAITGIHNGALNVNRIALVSGIIVIATKRAYYAAVPLTARSLHQCAHDRGAEEGERAQRGRSHWP